MAAPAIPSYPAAFEVYGTLTFVPQIPDEPFPRANDAAAADETAKRLVRNLILKWLGIFTVLGVSIYGGVQVCKK